MAPKVFCLRIYHGYFLRNPENIQLPQMTVDVVPHHLSMLVLDCAWLDCQRIAIPTELWTIPTLVFTGWQSLCLGFPGKFEGQELTLHAREDPTEFPEVHIHFNDMREFVSSLPCGAFRSH